MLIRTVHIIWLLAFFIPLQIAAQDKWRLAQETPGIKVYHSTTHGSGFKKIRVEALLEGSADRMLQILKDVPNYKRWVYGHKSGTVLKHVSSNEFYFYTETAMPWPVAARDAVVRARVNRDANNSITVVEHSDPGFIPAKNGKVRVPQSYVKWVITPAGDKKIRIQYHFEADPGGSLPPWVVNLFADKGPVESFRKLALMLKE